MESSFSSSLGNNSSRILVIGGTGMMGQHLVKASLAAGHPTAVLVRPASSSKLELLETIKASGATVIGGDIYDHESLVAAFHQVDVVISAVGHHGPHDLEDGQLRIVAAIKEAGGSVKRFVPSEYGCDVEQAARSAAVLEPARSIVLAKVRVRQAIRAAGIPHTFVCSYWAHGFVLPRLGDPHADGLPATRATVFGDDATRAIFVHEADMAAVTVRAVDDPRALDKTLYLRPPANTCSLAHLVRLWEDKTGRALDKYYMPDEELVNRIRDSPLPLNFQLAMVHATVVAGVCDQTVDAEAGGVEATELYPDVNYVTVHDYLDGLKESLTRNVNS